MNIQPVGQSTTCSFGIYADPGAGKTTFVGSGGQDYNILLIRSPEDKVDPIIGSGVNEAVVSNWEEMLDVQNYLHHEGSQYDWVWLEFALFQDRGLRDVYEAALDRAGPEGSAARKHRMQFGSDKGEYKTNMDRISALVADLSGDPQFHFGINFHPHVGPRVKTEDETDDDEGALEVQPWVQGRNMIPKITGMLNVLGYMYVTKAKIRGAERDVRRLQLDKTPYIYAKNQIKKDDGTSIIPEGFMINPTLPKFMEAYETRQRPKPKAAPRGRTRPAVRPSTRRTR